MEEGSEKGDSQRKKCDNGSESGDVVWESLDLDLLLLALKMGEEHQNQGMGAASRNWKRQEEILPWSLQKEMQSC